jgi:hypothetical protein
MWEKKKSVEAAIKRLTREIDEIDAYFYKCTENDDQVLHAGMLERKRDDIVRSAVLQMHTAIEDLLNSYLIFKITGRPRPLSRSQSAKALRKILFGGGSLGFEMKLNLAIALKLISGKVKDRLIILNTLRNKCSHNWLLNVPLRYGKRPTQKKAPLLLYDGRNLHGVHVFKDFVNEYSLIYLKLYIKCP